MKTRVALLFLALSISTTLSRAADPVIDALVAQIQSNPSSAPAATVQAATANQAIASDIFKAAFYAAPDQISAIQEAAIASTPELAPTVVEQALAKLTAGLSPEAAAKVAADTTASAIKAIPSSTPAEVKSKLVAAIAAAAVKAVPGSEKAVEAAVTKVSPDSAEAAKRKIHDGRNFPTQRPPIIVSPSR
ncbi:MAG: hypothetical protein QM760_22375 [Nibricoccus sp.]